MDLQHARRTDVRHPASEPSANSIVDATGIRINWLPMNLAAILEPRRSDRTCD